MTTNDYHALEKKVADEVRAEERAAHRRDAAPDPLNLCGLDMLPVGADVLDAANCLRLLAAGLNGSDALARRVIRVRAIQEVKRIGVADAAGLVDAALPRAVSRDPEGEGQGQAVVLSEPVPWPDPVDGAVVLAELVRTFARFLALTEGGATALALWALHAHAHDAAAISPLLVLASPEKRCGKTTALKVLSALVPRPLPTANISPAALFRTVEKYRPTLLLDEADTAFRQSEDLKAIVNAAHDRAQAVTVRTVGDDHDPRIFSTWCPKVIALIGKLPGTLTDRAIVVPMRRKQRAEKVERVRLDRLSQQEPLRRRACRWARDASDMLRGADPTMPELNDRAADNWRPLLAIADVAGGRWPELARRAAQVLSGGEETDDDAPAALLLADLASLFAERGDRLPTTEILEHLTGLDTRPWSEWRHGKAMTASQLSRLLKRFGIGPRTVRDGGAVFKGYVRADFCDAFSRYVPSTDRLHGYNVAAAEVKGPEKEGVTVTGKDIRGKQASPELDPDEEARSAMREGA